MIWFLMLNNTFRVLGVLISEKGPALLVHVEQTPPSKVVLLYPDQSLWKVGFLPHTHITAPFPTSNASVDWSWYIQLSAYDTIVILVKNVSAVWFPEYINQCIKMQELISCTNIGERVDSVLKYIPYITKQTLSLLLIYRYTPPTTRLWLWDLAWNTLCFVIDGLVILSSLTRVKFLEEDKWWSLVSNIRMKKLPHPWKTGQIGTLIIDLQFYHYDDSISISLMLTQLHFALSLLYWSWPPWQRIEVYYTLLENLQGPCLDSDSIGLFDYVSKSCFCVIQRTNTSWVASNYLTTWPYINMFKSRGSWVSS
jgi:hypothetical protein